MGKTLYCHFLYSQLFLYVATTASPLALVLASLERFIGIVYPLRYYQLVTNTKLKIAILLQWVISLVPGVQWLFLVYYSEEINSDSCSFTAIATSGTKLLFAVQFIIAYGFPVLALVYLYFRMFASIKTNARVGMNRSNEGEDEMVRARKNILMNLFIVTSVFVSLLTPCQIGTLMINVFETDTFVSQNVFYSFIYISILFNSVINPLVYAFRYKQYQRALLDLFPCRKA